MKTPYVYHTKEPPIDNDSQCSGAIGCELCRGCTRYSSLPKDGRFLLSAPGNQRSCMAYRPLDKLHS